MCNYLMPAGSAKLILICFHQIYFDSFSVICIYICKMIAEKFSGLIIYNTIDDIAYFQLCISK